MYAFTHLLKILSGIVLLHMNIIVNYWAVLGGAVFLFVAGGIWYGPMFGKVWMKITGADKLSKEEQKEAMKGVGMMYVLQFVLSLLTSYVFYNFVKAWNGGGYQVAFFVWLGFMMPQAAGVIWDSQKGLRMKKFLIVAGYQLITLLVLGYIFSIW
ncbi:MAG: hypothetical protein JWN37_376 [Candidatus Nomurabacteria bacterium]|nr:hypothetical protein [Candidatus Nomurabacteria bacterium]